MLLTFENAHKHKIYVYKYIFIYNIQVSRIPEVEKNRRSPLVLDHIRRAKHLYTSVCICICVHVYYTMTTAGSPQNKRTSYKDSGARRYALIHVLCSFLFSLYIYIYSLRI